MKFHILNIMVLSTIIATAQPVILKQVTIETDINLPNYTSQSVIPEGMAINSVGDIKTFGSFYNNIVSPPSPISLTYSGTSNSYYRMSIPSTGTVVGGAFSTPAVDIVGVGSSYYTLENSSGAMVVTGTSTVINISGATGYFIENDIAGNLLVVGKAGNNIVDINPDTVGTYSVPMHTFFVASYTTLGQFINAFTVPGIIDQVQDDGLSITIGGRFNATVNFGGAIGLKTAQASYDNFLARYSIANGSYGSLAWVSQLSDNYTESNSSSSLFWIRSIALDNSSGIVLLGDLNTGGSIDLDEGTGQILRSSNGNSDIVLARYNSIGQYQSSFTIGDADKQFGGSVKVDQAGNIYCVGSFAGTVDFNPDPNVEFLKSGIDDSYVVGSAIHVTDFIFKLSPGGEFRWVYVPGVPPGGFDFGFGLNLEIDSDQNLIFQAKRYRNRIIAGNQFYTWLEFIPYDYIMKFSQDPKITSFSVPNAPMGTPIQINGLNFSIVPSENTVLFNGVPAIVTASTVNQLSVVIPQGIVTSQQSVPVTVSVGGKTSSSNFTITYPSFLSTNTSKLQTLVNLNINKGGYTGAVSYSVAQTGDGGNATISGATLTPTKVGTVLITATIAADANYNAISINQLFTITCRPQAPTIGSLSIAPICSGTTISTLSYGTTNEYPNQYRIDWNNTANSAGMADVANTPLQFPNQTPLSGLTAPAGTYSGSLYVSHTGCAESIAFPVSLIVNPNPTLSITPSSPTICLGGFTNLNASGALTYTWSPSTGLSSTTGSSVTANPTSTATYAVTGVNGSGCSSNKQVTVTVNPLPTLTNSSNLSTCSGSNFNYIATSSVSGTTFSWSRAAVTGITPSSASGASATINETLTNNTQNPINVIYNFTMTVNGCQNQQSVVVKVNPIPQITNLPASINACNGSQAIFNFNSTLAGTAFNWTSNSSGVTGAPSSGSGNINHTLTGGGTVVYSVTPAKDGCSGVGKNLTVTVGNLPGTISTSGNMCTQGFVTLTAGTGTNYLWDDGATSQSVSSAAGSRTVTYVVSGGCHMVAGIFVGPCSDCSNPVHFCYERRRPEPEPIEEKLRTLGIYPNPADDEIVVEIEEPAQTNLQINMISQFGNKVRTSSIDKGGVKSTISVNDLAEGMYVITVQAGDGYIIREKIIVIHK